MPVGSKKTTSFWCSHNNVLHIPPGQQRAAKRSHRGNQSLNPPPTLITVCYFAQHGCLLGLQSQSDDTCSHGSREGGVGCGPAAALLWTQRNLPRITLYFHVLLHKTMLLFFRMVCIEKARKILICPPPKNPTCIEPMWKINEWMQVNSSMNSFI